MLVYTRGAEFEKEGNLIEIWNEFVQNYLIAYSNEAKSYNPEG
jgi:hypothetical protein